MMKEISLAGRHALITGGATGIGYAIAAEMIDAGARVTIVGRRLELLQKSAAELGSACEYAQFDITDTEGLPGFIAELEQKAPIDILVNNAGINIKRDYAEFTAQDFQAVTEIQEKAPFFLTQAVAGYMKERGRGCVIFISSLSSRLGMTRNHLYTMCKTGIVGMARSLSVDLAPHGIRVNSLNPGFVDTDLMRSTNSPERVKSIQEKTPLRELIPRKDIGMAAVFLASDAARYITGIDLVVDGGISNAFLI